MTSTRYSLFLVVLLAACGGTPTPAQNDAATPGTDGGGGGTDTGVTPDTGPEVDAGEVADTGTEVDAASDIDAAVVAGCPETFAGCTTIEDRTGETAVSIAITGFMYSPNCIRVSAGTVVTIAAAAIHPLAEASCSSEGSPLPAVAAVTEGDYTFDTAGSYGYYCNVHGSDTGTGMSGLIIVE